MRLLCKRVPHDRAGVHNDLTWQSRLLRNCIESAVGMPAVLLNTMAQGAAARGLVDASDGYMHAKMRVMIAGEHTPSCRAVTNKVNSNYCMHCRNRRKKGVGNEKITETNN